MKNIYCYITSVVFNIMICLISASCVDSSMVYGDGLPLRPKFYQPEYEVKIQRSHVTMPDGVKLAVTFFRPVAKLPNEKFPIVIEMVPYRKDDIFYGRDFPIYKYLAERGIAGARIDVRGTGSSGGRFVDREYSDAELNDLEFCIAEFSRLPWCNGKIGLQGKSWSAFNALMMAMRQPAALKAILVVHGSEDLYANDVHNIDGILHIDLFTMEVETENIMPAWPDYAIDKEYLRDRFDQKPWIFNYLRHQRDGKFWRDGRSLFTAYDKVNIPVYTIGGLLDGYRDYVISILDNVGGTVKAEIGPWNHDWPNGGSPGPNYNGWQTAVRWWKQWLCGEETGILNEPKFTIFVRDTVPARDDYVVTPGEFRSFDNWPLPDQSPQVFYFAGAGSLVETPQKPQEFNMKYSPAAGAKVGTWWGERTPDMRNKMEGAIIFDSVPLEKEKILIGQPKALLKVASDAPLANWVVLLEDVHPDGSVTFVTGAAVSGAQRKSRTDPSFIPPNTFFDLDVKLHFTTYTFAPGHKVRVVISNSLFPMLWPTPYLMNTRLAGGSDVSRIILPFVSSLGKPSDFLLKPADLSSPKDLREIGGHVGDPPLPSIKKEKGWVITHQEEGTSWAVGENKYVEHESISYRVNELNPAMAGFSGKGDMSIEMPGRKIEIFATIDIESDMKYFNVRVTRKILENGKLRAQKQWKEKIKRDFQ
ncbi:MAG: CocE/NonD family hydrolase [Candidatus Omnitrophota bacterium]|nr:CocE/NonD family hydrolase [Candidatus Omnitrophota bacterium]